MKATISQTREVNRTGRSKMGRSIIYVESPLYKVADKFASDHNVFGLPFKSKTWGKVCQQVTKTHIVELKKLFPEALEIKFSQTAGCRCGCSPGYIMKHEAINTERTSGLISKHQRWKSPWFETASIVFVFN
jgi:hypothetical protein